MDFWALRLMEPKDMAENMMGTPRVRLGYMGVLMVLVFSSTTSFSGLRPKMTLVSMGSRSGSIEGLVTCDALSSMWSQ